MKMFKRFAAALLAGVMVLAMLTACGGGAGSGAAKSDTEKLEDMYQNVFNAALGTELSNDFALKTAAKTYLTENLNEDGTLPAGKNMAIVTEPDADGYVVLVSIMTDEGFTDEEVKAMIEDPSAVNKMIADIKKSDGYESMAAVMKTVVKGMGTGAVKKGNVTNVAAALKVPKAIADAMIEAGAKN